VSEDGGGGGVVEVIQGVRVADPFRWLEDGDSARTRNWTAAQNGDARAALDALPGRDRLRARLVELLSVRTVAAPAVRGDHLFTIDRGGPGNAADQSVLVVRSVADGPRSPRRVLVDPQALLDDETAALDWYHPSADGARAAVGLSTGGDERSILQIVETATGRLLDDAIPHTRAASVAWAPGSDAFAYTRYPDPIDVGEEAAQYGRAVFWHDLGEDPAGDRRIWDDRPDPAAWADVSTSRDGRWLLVHVAIGWDRIDVHLLDRAQPAADWQPVIAGVEALTSFTVDSARHRLVGTTTLDAPKGRVVAIPLPEAGQPVPPPQQWDTVVPESEAVIEDVAVTAGSLLVATSRSAVSHLTRYQPDGALPQTVELPEPGSLGGIAADGDHDRAWFSFTSFTRPEQVWRWAPEGVNEWTAAAAAVDPDRFTVTEASYPSTDGTPVHAFLIGPATDTTGAVPRPTILTGYGGFGVTMGPAFSPLAVAHAEAGGLTVVANIRGGTEEGEEWHRAGQRQHKQQVFDDFAAAAGWLVAQGRTTPDQLAMRGGSNGGLLVAATLTQRPDLCRAVHCAVPLTDMVRYDRFLIAKLWVPEYGDPAVAEEFEWLHAYSPYHHVVDGTCYPAVLITTGEQDSRVDPGHARKFAARLQQATSCLDQRPILLRLEERAGHGQGKPIGRQADELADVLSFLLWQLGVADPSDPRR